MTAGSGLREISIHAPREGGDSQMLRNGFTISYFNPRPPRGGRLRDGRTSRPNRDFNPRPPRGGRRFARPHPFQRLQRFQSTPPARGATLMTSTLSLSAIHFNPRPPRGGRPRDEPQSLTNKGFQSTPPARGATAGYFLDRWKLVFQSTPPARGAAQAPAAKLVLCGDFNPRPPRGGRHVNWLSVTTR